MKKSLGIIFGAVSALSYGTNPLFGVKLLRAGFSVDSMLFWRFAGAAILIFPLALILSRGLRMKPVQLAWAAVLGVLFAFSAESLFYAFTVMAAGVASTMLFFYPIFVALIMAFVFGEKIGRSTVAAIILSFIGVIVLGCGDIQGASISLSGIIFVMLSALTYAFYIVIVKVTSVASLNGVKLTFFVLVFATIFMLVKGLICGSLQLPSTQFELLNVAGLIILPTALSITAIAYSIKYAGATVAAVLGALEPATAVSISVLALGEPFTSSLAIGLVLIVASVILLTLSDTKHRIFAKFMRGSGAV